MKEGRTALIGHTGFVGGTLLRARGFDDLYHSANIGEIGGKSYDLVICAGVPAAKWLANKEPEADRAGIAKLTDALGGVEAREFVLISTIDVYSDPASGADETATIEPTLNHPYGRHRYELERWVAERFAGTRIVRLPALFGEGLRKNALYDLLNGNNVESINPAGRFQWYPMARLARDLEGVREADLDLVNLFTEPFAMAQIIDALFPDAPVGPAAEPAPGYDLRTRHASLFGGENGYIMNAEAVLGAMAAFVAAERRRARGD
jgi:hypothetical protein